MYLLLNADEHGRAEVNLNDYAAKVNVPRSSIQYLIETMKRKGILSQEVRKESAKQPTTLNICKYVYYDDCENDNPQEIRKESVNVKEKEKREGLSSPCTPFLQEKDKEREDLGLTRKKEPCGNFSLSLEERRSRFWEKIKEYAKLHPEYPVEAVKGFYLYWTQEVVQQREDGSQLTLLAFEAERKFGLPYRLSSFVKHGSWLKQVRDNRLARASGKKPKSAAQEDLEKRQKQARLIEESERAERERKRDEQAEKAATPEEIRKILGDRCVI